MSISPSWQSECLAKSAHAAKDRHGAGLAMTPPARTRAPPHTTWATCREPVQIAGVAPNPLQQQIALLAADLATEQGFALVGGAALDILDIVDRAIQDLTRVGRVRLPCAAVVAARRSLRSRGTWWLLRGWAVLTLALCDPGSDLGAGAEAEL